MSEEILLSNLKPFGEGNFQLCYIHPQDPNKCLKIKKREIKRGNLLSARRANFLALNEYPLRGLFGYCKLLNENSPLSNWIAPHYGIVKTDKGIAISCKLIKDENGNISPSLSEWIHQKGKLEINHPVYIQFLEILRDIKNSNIMPDFLGGNILVQTKKKEMRLFLIDGFEFLRGRTFIPIYTYSLYLKKLRILKKIRNIWNEILKNPLSKKEMRKIYESL